MQENLTLWTAINISGRIGGWRIVRHHQKYIELFPDYFAVSFCGIYAAQEKLDKINEKQITLWKLENKI